MQVEKREPEVEEEEEEGGEEEVEEEEAMESSVGSAAPQELGRLQQQDALGSAGQAKPQLRFADVIDNSTSPFVCKHPAAGSGIAGHPYAEALAQLTFDSNRRWHPMAAEPPAIEPVAPLTATPWTWIDTPEALHALVDELNQADEFAFDTEQHSYRSYQGFICIIQISTRSRDYLIDTICLRHCVSDLNEPFTNASILKVAHGCNDDIVRLQRDFGVFVVNVFDTEVAAKAIGCRRVSLTELYYQYCEVPSSPDLARADWRVRPLPADMIEYCRTDTHYLLALRDRLLCGIHHFDHEKTRILADILEQGKALCLRLYEKKTLPSSCRQDINFRAGLHKLKADGVVPTNEQMIRIENLYRLRDTIARREDEGVQYVLPKMLLLQIALAEPPKNIEELLERCTGAHVPLILKYASEVVAALQSITSTVEIRPPIVNVKPRKSGGVVAVEVLNPAHAKSILHHVAQMMSKGKRMPKYETVSEGLSHKPQFITTVSLEVSPELTIEGRGQGSTKRDAERLASFCACQRLVENGLLSSDQVDSPTEDNCSPAQKHDLLDDPNGEKRELKRLCLDGAAPVPTWPSVPVLSRESSELHECHLYSLHLPNIDKDRLYPHIEGHLFDGFNIISSVPLYIPDFKVSGKGYAALDVQVTTHGSVQLHSDQLDIVSRFQDYMFRTILRIEKQLRYPSDCLYILPKFSNRGSGDDQLNISLIESLMRATPAHELLKQILNRAGITIEQVRTAMDVVTEEGVSDTSSLVDHTKKQISNNFDGRIFFTRYNGLAYVLCGIDFGVSPQCWFRTYNHQWQSFVEYYRQKKIELSDHCQPMIMANQSNMGAQAIILPGTTDTEGAAREGAPSGVPLARGNCLYMPLELCDLSGVTFEMSTKFIHYLPMILNHIHNLQVFYNKLPCLQHAAHISISDPKLLKQALTHTSYSNLRECLPEHNERLEYLGDAVLEFIVATRVYLQHPEFAEGELTNKKREYIRNMNLAKAAKRINLSRYLLTEGKLDVELAMLSADAFEALIGTIYLDKGIDEANSFCERWLFDLVEPPNAPRFVRSPLFTKPTNDLGGDICPPIVHPDAQREAKLHDAEAILGISFQNKNHLLQALTHSSFGGVSSEQDKEAEWSYERLEFLGDSLLKFIITAHLYHISKSQVREEMLTDQRSMLVRNQTLARCTLKLGLQPLILAKAPANMQQEKMLGDVIESLIGAAYVDQGMADREQIMNEHGCGCGVDVFGCLVHKLVIAQCSDEYYLAPDKADVDAKGLLQSMCLRRGFSIPRYQLLQGATTNSDSLPQFEVGVSSTPEGEMEGETLQATGRGSTVADAHKAAARAALALWLQ